MTFAYREYEVLPTPGQPRSVIHRPVIPVRLSGPKGTQTILGLVDTGSDVTVLPAFLLSLIGTESGSNEEAHFRGVGGQIVTVRYRDVELGLDHGDGLHRWNAQVGFLDGCDVAATFGELQMVRLPYSFILSYGPFTEAIAAGRKPNRTTEGGGRIACG